MPVLIRLKRELKRAGEKAKKKPLLPRPTSTGIKTYEAEA
jgi:hypothetical protein